MRITYIFMLAFACITLTANGHYLWIELGAPAKLGKQQEVRIFYGEYNEGVREVRGGRMEELAGISAWVITPGGKQIPLPITTEEKFYKSTFTPEENGTYTVVAVNTVREVVDWSKHGIGVVRPVYYTYKEVIIGQGNKHLTNFPQYAQLKIQPAKGKNSFTLKFKGQPLANAKVWFHAPNEWSKELSTNEEGIVSFNPLWKGQYVVECIYPEKNPGTFNGKDYEAIRHRATLSIDVQ